MNLWSQQAREEAARQWGRRHYRFYAAWHYLRLFAPAVGVLAATVATIAAMWILAQHSTWANALRIAAAALGAGLLVWLAGQAFTGAGIRHRASGRRHPIAALTFASVVLLASASVLIR